MCYILVTTLGSLILLGITLRNGYWTTLTPEDLCNNPNRLFPTICIKGYAGNVSSLYIQR